MTQEQQDAAVAAAQAPLRELCREMLGTLRARGVPPVPVVAFRRSALARDVRAVRLDVAWPLRTLHAGHPALFADGSLRPARAHRAPEQDGVTTTPDATESAAPQVAGPWAARPRTARLRWAHALVGTSPGSPYLSHPGDPLTPATAVPSRFVGMPIPGGAGGDLGVAHPSGQLLYPTVHRLPEGEEVSWWPLAPELAGAVTRLAEEYGATPWPDPRDR